MTTTTTQTAVTGDPWMNWPGNWYHPPTNTYGSSATMKGWECPRCNRILSPLTSCCPCHVGYSLGPTYIYSSIKATPGLDSAVPLSSGSTLQQTMPASLFSSAALASTGSPISDDELKVRLRSYANLVTSAPGCSVPFEYPVDAWQEATDATGD